MTHKIFLYCTLLAAFLSPAVLCSQSPAEQRSRWMEELKKNKTELFTQEMGLTKDQQNEFFPLYEEMEEAIYKVNKEADSLMKKVAEATDVSDTEYEAAALAITKRKQQEGEIEMEYYAKFEKILSKKQLFLLKIAEDKFTKNLLTHHRQKK